MAINPILNAVSAALAQQSAPASVRSTASVSANGATQPAPPVTDSSPSQPVVQNAGLLNASSNFAQLGSLLEIAQSGTQQIGAIITQLQDLARQAANSVAPGDINGTLKQLLSEINQIVASITFGGTKLLDGTQSGTTADQTFSLPDLSAQGLFGTDTPNLSSPQDAAAALAVFSQAQGVVGDASASIGDLLGQLGFAAASVDSALANGTAAASTLNEADLTNGSATQALADFLSQSSFARQAQTGNITANLLSLLQE